MPALATPVPFRCGACGEEHASQILLDQHSQRTHGPPVSLPGKLNR